MDARTLIFTANYGGRDVAHPQETQSIDVDWFYITDGPETAPAPWRTIRGVAEPGVHPNMAAKWWRTHPPFRGVAPVVAEYDHAIWIDANMGITSPTFASDVLSYLGDAPLALWQHPRRDCIYDEVEASLVGREAQGGRYDHLPMRQQAQSYRDEGFPEHAGLYATGTLVWPNTAIAALLGHQWYLECDRWGYQDQVSLPVVCHRLGVEPAVFPVHQTEGGYNRRQRACANRWMRIYDHQPGTEGGSRAR